MPIRDSDRLRHPLLSEAGAAMLDRLKQDPDAPRWNHELGDRVTADDLAAVSSFRRALREPRPPRAPGDQAPGLPLLEWVAAMRPRVPLFQEMIPEGTLLARDFGDLPTMSRNHLATRLGDVVPTDADLSRVLAYDTSGTTGHALQIPHHPGALALNHALAELALEQHGVQPSFAPDQVACVNLRAAADCYVFANVFSVWNQAGFVRLNLHPGAWPGGPDAARRYLERLAPVFVTGDPIAFDELIRWGITLSPSAMISTAVTLEAAHAARLAAHFGCPVIDWYSTTETGPIACTRPDAPAGTHALLSHDLYVEIVGDDPDDPDIDRPRPPGVSGEIAVTGGRNPYLPLLRYRTGDRAALALEPFPHLVGLQGRAPTFFRALDGTPINAVDIGRALRLRAVFVQHEFVQRVDGSCAVTLRPTHGIPIDTTSLGHDLAELFRGRPVTVTLDEQLGDDRPGGKLLPYRCELDSPPG